MLLAIAATWTASSTPARSAAPDFDREVAPILEARCLECHGANEPKGGFSLVGAEQAIRGGDSGPAIVPGRPEESSLLDYVTPGADGKTAMPKNREPLTAAQIETLRRWIAAGAPWPAGRTLRDRRFENYRWWSLEPLTSPTVPASKTGDPSESPIDAFLDQKLAERNLIPAPEAAAATLIRRLYFDLIGLPPTPEEVEAFVRSYSQPLSPSASQPSDPQHSSSHPPSLSPSVSPSRDGARTAAYAALVEKLLASKHYGERWARHWLDVVHFGETHGYDKDKPRPNAWPYRDYVIRAFNADKPYARFVEEQLAGDVLYPGTRDGLEALGFIAAGPWDFIGHAEVPETKIDGKVARHLDRDDMITNTVQTFAGLTIQCAQCHDHKFDPIRQEDYYALQAVFAAVDRTDRKYDLDPAIARRRTELASELSAVATRKAAIEQAAATRSGNELKKLDAQIAALQKPDPAKPQKADAYGFHSAISPTPDVAKWVQIDLGRSLPIASIGLHPCRDSFAGIGDGFGFPVRYKVDISDDPTFAAGTVTVADYTPRDVSNPGIQAQAITVNRQPARYVRITATKLAHRKNDYIFALAEAVVIDAEGRNVAAGATVTSLDSIEAQPRWRRTNLVDGYYPGVGLGDPEQIAPLTRRRNDLFAELLTEIELNELAQLEARRATLSAEHEKLPAQSTAYIGAVHTGGGNFRGTGHEGGKPRPIHLLARGNVTQPQHEVAPGAISSITALPARFDLPSEAPEGERRAALARWLTDAQNPLTWRVIVNRVWQYHFGRGLVDTPNDFGRNGARPTHPELLDWLAADFRDHGGSLKRLHRQIVLSNAYRRASTCDPAAAAANTAIDADNRYLARQNRRRIEAESLRDAMLVVSGLLDRTMYGPSFQDFVIEKPEHSPHYEYHLHDPADPKSHRRSVYRFIVRSQPQPFMTTFDCADPSMQVDRRNESVSPLQALTLLNGGLTIVAADRMAARLESAAPTLEARVQRGFTEATGRRPTAEEQAALVAHAVQYGLPSTCRLIFNLNEFLFVD
jgi:mono/diheme cytochrome c family protein